jgi:hypothetical protein
MLATHWPWGDTWRGSPIAVHRGTIAQVMASVPEFERRDFVAGHAGLGTRGRHARLDTIVRLPLRGEHEVIPVGVVSKHYALVPHRQVLRVAAEALAEAGLSVDEVDATVTLTEYGERMALSLCLPARYHVDPGDGHPMALRLECFNAVDGSLRFRALMGWFRFVCRNGLVVGVTLHEVRCRHVVDLPLTGLEAVVQGGLDRFELERDLFARWRDRAVSLEQVEHWADTRVKDAWGLKAAARTCHIARTGRDAEVIGPSRACRPVASRRPRATRCLAVLPQTLFDLSQALAWLAKERRDVAEQLEWREQIPALLAPLEAA